MNKKLQNILDIIQQSEKLDAEQKDKLLKAVKEADKELEITAFKLERTEKVKKTTAILLEETIEELEQKRKAVEEQNRELEIEAALERVRARAMGMRKSEEAGAVSDILFAELNKLGFDISGCSMVVIDEDNDTMELWRARSDVAVKPFDSTSFTESMDLLKKNMPDWFSTFIKALGKRENYLIDELLGERRSKFINLIAEQYKYSSVEKSQLLKNAPEKITTHFIFFKLGYLGLLSEKKLSIENLSVARRFVEVFDFAYTRFLDIKKAEAQAREAEIELALERVRARSMAMQKSEELKEVIKLVYEQFVQLKINVDHAGFVVDYTPKGNWHFWIADQQEIPSKITHPYFDSVWAHQFNEAKEKGIDFFATNLNFEEKNKFYTELLSYVPGLPDKSKDFYLSCPGLAATTVLFHNVSLYIENFSGTPYTDEENKILMRFGKVFEQTYTRFLDLQKAEAQAWEAQIESSLEKVRAVAMSMNKSDDLLSICEVSFKEFKKLGFENIRNALIHIQYDEQKYFMDYDFSDLTGGAITKIEYGSHPVVEDYLQKISSAEDAFYQGVIKEDQLEEWKSFRRNSGQIDDPRLEKATAIYYYFFSIGVGDIGISTLQPIDESRIKILKRFRNVFDLAYRRYNDIALAEEQAREAKIEASLEKVRTVALTMKRSDEMLDIAQALYEQLLDLGFTNIRNAIIDLHNEKDETFLDYDYSHDMGKTVTLMSYYDHPIIEKQVRQIESSTDAFFELILEGQELQDLIDIRLKNGEAEDPRLRQIDQLTYNLYSFGNGAIGISNFGLLSDEHKMILKRFRNVFAFAYKRYSDMVQAETQAREAEIEAALERVRSRTMAMQKSDELAETASHLFDQLNGLGIKPYRFNIAIVDSNSEKCQLWSTTNEGRVIPNGPLIPLKEHKVFNQMYDGWIQQDGVSVIRIQGDDRIAWTKYIMNYVSFDEYKPENVDLEKLRHEPAIFSNFFFKQGIIVVHTVEEIDKTDIKIIQRFIHVFEQTYTRFLDLQKAEAQAREAIKQASLDRIRGEIASMRTAEDLNRITPIIWRELKNLEVPFIRCGVYIVDEKTETVQVYLTTPEGKSLGVLNLSFDSNKITSDTVDHWRKKQIYKQHWNKEEFINWTKSMIETGQVKNAETYQGSSAPPESLDLHFVPFTQGMLYVGDVNPLTDEKLELVITLAKAFSIAYARYEDFTRLEEAKRSVESAFGELDVLSKELKIKNEKLETENLRKANELEEARRLQLALLPDTIPKLSNLDIAVYMLTATEVGGDYYDFHQGSDGTLTVAIGDATGHGMKAGTMVTITKSLFNSLASDENILNTFSNISRVIKDMKLRRLSMCLLMLKIKGNKILISSAAMPPALIYRKKDKTVEELLLKGMPLGAMNNYPYTLEESQLQSGDTILLLSDGLPELTNVNKEMYGYERTKSELQSVGEKEPEEIVNHLKDSASKWVNGTEQDDDITFVVVKVK